MPQDPFDVIPTPPAEDPTDPGYDYEGEDESTAGDRMLAAAVAAELTRLRARKIAELAFAREQVSEIRDKRKTPIYTRQAMRDLPPSSYLIASWLAEHEINLLWGPYGTFKTFLALSMACSVATGQQWCRLETQRRRVIYVAPEGASGINKRITAWERAYGLELEDLDFILVKQANFYDRAATEAFLADVRDTLGHDLSDVLIVADTVNRVMTGGDENSSRDISLFVANLDYLKDELSATVLLVHHTGKDGTKGARGSIALPSAVNNEMGLQANDRGNIELTSHKVKDDAKPGVLELSPRAKHGSVVLCGPGDGIPGLASNPMAFAKNGYQPTTGKAIGGSFHTAAF